MVNRVRVGPRRTRHASPDSIYQKTSELIKLILNSVTYHKQGVREIYMPTDVAVKITLAAHRRNKEIGGYLIGRIDPNRKRAIIDGFIIPKGIKSNRTSIFHIPTPQSTERIIGEFHSHITPRTGPPPPHYAKPSVIDVLYQDQNSYFEIIVTTMPHHDGELFPPPRIIRLGNGLIRVCAPWGKHGCKDAILFAWSTQRPNSVERIREAVSAFLAEAITRPLRFKVTETKEGYSESRPKKSRRDSGQKKKTTPSGPW